MKTSAAILIGAIVLVAGCRSDNGRRPVTGKVTFKGQPVAMGQIVFAPDASKGIKGPAGVAEIRDGEYRTSPEFGAVAGPHIAELVLGDGKNPSPMRPYGHHLTDKKILVPIDIPIDGGAIDFTLPAGP